MMRRLTHLRHGPLRRYRFVWSTLRPVFRVFIRVVPGLTVSKMIGPYGPFRLNGRFTFSNFGNWGSNHNRGFQACVDAASGMSCVLDIGAHIGLVSLPLSSSISKTGTVFAFEPAEANRAFLEEHIRRNQIGNIEVVADLVGDREIGDVPFFESGGDSGMNTVASSGSQRGYATTTKNQITLDRFCADRNISPELIKIDTEGAEVMILLGAKNVLKKNRPVLYLSVHPRHIIELGSSVEELETLLRELDYKVADMDGNEVRPTELTEYVVTPR